MLLLNRCPTQIIIKREIRDTRNDLEILNIEQNNLCEFGKIHAVLSKITSKILPVDSNTKIGKINQLTIEYQILHEQSNKKGMRLN